MSLLEVQSLRFAWGQNRPRVLDIAELTLEAGETLFLQGPSGCGKSTLLSALAGVVDVPEGATIIEGIDLATLKGAERDRFRVDHMGLVFQMFNLLPWLSAVENVLLPCTFSDTRKQSAGPDPEQTALGLLESLGLDAATVANTPTMDLSVGQQQRVAAARALIGAPALVLADEPTSALDEGSRDSFVRLLKQECAASNAGLIFVSHDRSLGAEFDRVVDFASLNKGGAKVC